MCNPVAFMAVGAGVSALSSISAGNFADDIGAFNQASLNKQADARIESGKVEEQRHRYKIADFKGKQQAAFGASGVDVSSGSPVDILSDTAAVGELDALTIRNNAEADAFSLRVAGQGEALKGKLAKRQGFGNAVGSILTTSGSIAAL